MRLLSAAVAALALLPSPASALPGGLPVGSEMRCLTAVTNRAADGSAIHFTSERGVLRLNADDRGRPASYDYDAEALPERAPRAGGWSFARGRITFRDGPLDGQGVVVATGRYAAPEARMPFDQVRGRTFPVVLRARGNGGGTWFCGGRGLAPRVLLRDQIDWVERESGLRVWLPQYLRPGLYEGQRGFRGRVRSVTAGAWRYEIQGTPCDPRCFPVGWFGAHVLRGEAYGEGLENVRLADGGRAFVNTPGCGFSSGPRSFVPVVCGRPLISWVRGGIEYSIQFSVGRSADLVRWANQVVAPGR